MTFVSVFGCFHILRVGPILSFILLKGRKQPVRAETQVRGYTVYNTKFTGSFNILLCCTNFFSSLGKSALRSASRKARRTETPSERRLMDSREAAVKEDTLETLKT